MLTSEVGGEAAGEIGGDSVGHEDGDPRGRGQLAEPGQNRSRAGHLVVELEDVEELQACAARVPDDAPPR